LHLLMWTKITTWMSQVNSCLVVCKKLSHLQFTGFSLNSACLTCLVISTLSCRTAFYKLVSTLWTNGCSPLHWFPSPSINFLEHVELNLFSFIFKGLGRMPVFIEHGDQYTFLNHIFRWPLSTYTLRFRVFWQLAWGIQHYWSIYMYIYKQCSRVNTLQIWIQMWHKQNKKTFSVWAEI
jgi:hypothetical protein